jgi:hypothetical protein
VWSARNFVSAESRDLAPTFPSPYIGLLRAAGGSCELCVRSILLHHDLSAQRQLLQTPALHLVGIVFARPCHYTIWKLKKFYQEESSLKIN